MTNSDSQKRSTPLLEWVAATVGLILIASLCVIIGREAVRGKTSEPPSIIVTVENIAPASSGYVVAFKAANRSGGTAAALQIVGMLRQDGRVVEESSATIDYVPGDGRAGGGLIFEKDPRGYDLSVRATGFEDP